MVDDLEKRTKGEPSFVEQAFEVLQFKGVDVKDLTSIYANFNADFMNENEDYLDNCIGGKESMIDYFNKQDMAFLQFARDYKQ